MEMDFSSADKSQVFLSFSSDLLSSIFLHVAMKLAPSFLLSSIVDFDKFKEREASEDVITVTVLFSLSRWVHFIIRLMGPGDYII